MSSQLTQWRFPAAVNTLWQFGSLIKTCFRGIWKQQIFIFQFQKIISVLISAANQVFIVQIYLLSFLHFKHLLLLISFLVIYFLRQSVPILYNLIFRNTTLFHSPACNGASRAPPEAKTAVSQLSEHKIRKAEYTTSQPLLPGRSLP